MKTELDSDRELDSQWRELIAAGGCGRCNSDLAGTQHCLDAYDVTFPDGARMAVVPYRSASGRPCGDCGVVDGSVHHEGCMEEQCPRCAAKPLDCLCQDEQDQ